VFGYFISQASSENFGRNQKSAQTLRNVNIAHRERLRKLEKLDLFITNGVGSMGFFFSVFAWTALWLSRNTLAPKPLRFDPSPPLLYGFLFPM
jgi:uncharacterized membrane protein